jgi:hypothetical protein
MTQPLLTLHVPMRAVSLNRYQRMFWGERARHRRDTMLLVRAAMPMAVINATGWPAAEPVRIDVVATMKPPLLDADNVVVKDIIDALREWVIVDDSAAYVTGVTPIVRRGAVDAVTVLVWESQSVIDKDTQACYLVDK